MLHPFNTFNSQKKIRKNCFGFDYFESNAFEDRIVWCEQFKKFKHSTKKFQMDMADIETEEVKNLVSQPE